MKYLVADAPAGAGCTYVIGALVISVERCRVVCEIVFLTSTVCLVHTVTVPLMRGFVWGALSYW